MIERTTEDRRVKSQSVEEDFRKIRRRKEDRANIRSYYLVLGLSISTLVFIGIISVIWGR